MTVAWADKLVVLGRGEKATEVPRAVGALDQLMEVGISLGLLLTVCGVSLRLGEAAARTAACPAEATSSPGCTPGGPPDTDAIPRINGVAARDAGVPPRSADTGVARVTAADVISAIPVAADLSNGVPVRETYLTVMLPAMPGRIAGVIDRTV
jgi:hypothetical protein